MRIPHLRGQGLINIAGVVLIILLIVLGMLLVNVIAGAAEVNVNGQTSATAASAALAAQQAIDGDLQLARTISGEDGLSDVLQNSANGTSLLLITRTNLNLLRASSQVNAFYFFKDDGSYLFGQSKDPNTQTPGLAEEPPSWYGYDNTLRMALYAALRGPRTAGSVLLTFNPSGNAFGTLYIFQPIATRDGRGTLGALVEAVNGASIFAPYIGNGGSGYLFLAGNVVIGPALAAELARNRLPVIAPDARMDASMTGGLVQTTINYPPRTARPAFTLNGRSVIGTRKAIAGAKVNGAPLQVISYASATTVTDAARRVLLVVTAFVTLLVIGVVALILYLNRHLERGERENARRIQAKNLELIEAHKQIERMAEARFRQTFNDAPIGIAIISPDDRFVEANKALCEMLGYSEQELVGRGFMDVLHPEDRAHAVPLSHEDVHEDNAPHFKLTRRYITKSHEIIWVEITATHLRDDRGNLLFGLGMIQNITARKEGEEVLRQAKEEAERANRAKSAFLSRISHELRTPLNAILGFAQVLEHDPIGPKELGRVAYIKKAGLHLLDLINEVLDIARIEAGRMAISIEPVRIQAVVEDCLDLIAPLAEQAHVTVHMDASVSNHTYVMADYQRLKQVLVNLLANGVKYNHREGAVLLACAEHRAGWLRLTVTDTGAGIAGAQLEHLFTPFERLNAEQSGVEGTGLGLTLSKVLIEAMAGVIGVESILGTGSTFWVELPLVQDARPDLGPGAEPALFRTTPDSSHTVLHIEDNPSNVALIESMLTKRPRITLMTAVRGNQGVELARHHQPHLILLDLHLPDLSGAEVLRQLKDDPTTRSIPVVVVSADATEGQATQLLAAGARAYLTKPLDMHDFLHVLDAAVIETQG